MAKTTKDSGKLKNWQDVDKAYKQYAQKDANVTYLTAFLNSERDQRKELGESITDFVKSHTAELGPSGKKLLESGQISLTKSMRVEWKDAGETLKYVKNNNLTDCYKVEETLDRKALGKLGPDIMAAAGVEIVTEDKVTLKPNSQSPNCSLNFR